MCGDNPWKILDLLSN